jgi:glutamate carboxypeptidase
MHGLLVAAHRKQAALLALTKKLVLCESPTDEKAAVDACMALAAEQVKALGGRVRLHRQKNYGDLLEARFGSKDKAQGRIMLLGHLDTVWPLGTLATMPCKVGGGRLWGPGTLDMKAGVAMALTALEILSEAGLLQREVVLLLNSEEEVGSPISRPVTERLAADCEAVYVLESAQGLAYKTARKGNGVFRIEVQGLAAHSGVDFGKGASAIRELAHVIETVSGWTDLERGLTVNPGVVGGGSKVNVVAAQAWAEVDVRIMNKADGPRIERKFARLKPVDKRCTLAVSGSINRPPMERSKGTVKLLRRAQALAGELGIALDEAASGGASDGNFTAAMGIPTLDGMGAVGEGAHARHESIVLEHLAPRTALLAAMLT